MLSKCLLKIVASAIALIYISKRLIFYVSSEDNFFSATILKIAQTLFRSFVTVQHSHS